MRLWISPLSTQCRNILIGNFMPVVPAFLCSGYQKESVVPFARVLTPEQDQTVALPRLEYQRKWLNPTIVFASSVVKLLLNLYQREDGRSGNMRRGAIWSCFSVSALLAMISLAESSPVTALNLTALNVTARSNERGLPEERSAVLIPNDVIILADTENRTGDTIFDDSLKQA